MIRRQLRTPSTCCRRSWYSVLALDVARSSPPPPRSLLQVTYLVSLSSVGDLKARGPALVRQMAGWAAPVSGGLSAGFYPIKCAFGLSFYQQTVGTVVMPLIFFAMFSVVEKLRSYSTAWGNKETLRHLLVTGAVMTAYLLYPSLVGGVLQVFLCHGKVEGQYFLLMEMERLCFDGTHALAVVCALVVLVCPPLLLPSFTLLSVS